MKTNGTIRLLCTEQDREKLQPILDALAAKGLRAAAGEPGRDDVTLAATLGELLRRQGKDGQAPGAGGRRGGEAVPPAAG